MPVDVYIPDLPNCRNWKSGDFEKGCPIDLKIIEKIEPGDSYNHKKGNNETC